MENKTNILSNLFEQIEEILSIEKCSKLNKILEPFRNMYNNEIKFLIKSKFRVSIPIFGYISSGKSSLLNAFIGSHLLEVGSQISSKFACVIRHSKEKETKFYSAEIKNVKIDQMPIYYFEKKDLIACGNDDIREQIKKVNKSLTKENDDKLNTLLYENIVNEGFDFEEILKDETLGSYFYILEVNLFS